ncbi:type II toxin-antitoxin system RelB/DinJ family antitoxin [Candidatus Peregrinibacteria bacterium]|nr:type II toxin-antitoxin system RelB/DinJ family antitoxin [Candidatus Peregrinibacteria bacterium]
MKTLQIRISDDDKKAADSVLEQIGIDMPTAIRLYLKKIVVTKSIPFELSIPKSEEMYETNVVDVDTDTQKLMNKVISEWKKHKKK